MQRLQAQVEDIVRKDPDVAGVVSIIGVSKLNPTPNAGRLAITLKPRDERRDFVDEIIERLKEQVAPIPGMTVHFQPVQDIQISTRPSRAQYQYTLVGSRRERRRELVGKAGRPARAPIPICARSPPKRRRAACGCW